MKLPALSHWIARNAFGAGVLAVAVLPAAPLPGGEVHFLDRARASMEAGQTEAALAIVEEGLRDPRLSSKAPHAWLLAARIRGAMGDYAGAAEAYRRAEAAVPALGDCAVLGKSDLAFELGLFQEAESGYAEGLAKYPGSFYARRMSLGEGRAAVCLGDWPRARVALESFLKTDTAGAGEEETIEALSLLGEALLQLGDGRAALAAYERLWEQYPASPEGQAADDTLESIEKNRGLARRTLSAEQMFERARRLDRGGRFGDAHDQYDEILSAYPTSDMVPEVLLEQGSLYFREGKNQNALDVLRDLVKRYPQSDPAPDGLYMIARIHWRKGFKHHFVATCEEVLKTYPESRAAENAEFALGVFYFEERKGDRAREVLRAIVSGRRDHSRRRDALWQLGRMDYGDGDFSAAYRSFQGLASDESSGYWKAATYWAGRSLERLGRSGEARALFVQLAAKHRGDYYGIEAARRLADPEMGGEGGAPPVDGPPVDFGLPAGWGGAPYVRVLLLEEVGFFELASEEMAALLQKAPPGARLKFGLLAQRAGQYRRAADDIENHYGDLIQTVRDGLPREFWEVAFPYAYRAEIERAAAEFKMDPLLVAAVVREESRFEEDAVSRAGAVGLLQLMPATARDEARRLGMRTRDLDLFDPGTNLRLGIYSLSRRLERFDGDLVFALAGYNAGDHRARRWRDEFGGREQDEFIDRIPYQETRLYVKRILASYAHYRRIYGSAG